MKIMKYMNEDKFKAVHHEELQNPDDEDLIVTS
jgi:hypothetical protein